MQIEHFGLGVSTDTCPIKMPIYEYKCPNCGEKIEIISTPSEKVICKCGCEMKKIISPPAFRVYTKVR